MTVRLFCRSSVFKFLQVAKRNRPTVKGRIKIDEGTIIFDIENVCRG